MIVYVAVLFLIILPGCCIGPDYKKPDIILPQEYSLRLDGCSQAMLSQWWKVFEDEYLEKYIEQGLDQNYDLRIALEKIEESRNLYRIKIADVFPQVNFFAGVLKTNLGKTILSPLLLDDVNSSVVALDSLWEVDIWGRLRKSKNAARYAWQAQIEDMRDVAIMLAAEIAQTYFTLCALQRKIKILEKNRTLDTKILHLYKETFTAGLENKQTPLEQSTSIDLNTTQIIGFKIDQQVAYNKLAYLLGTTPDQLLFDRESISYVPYPHEEITLEKPYELLRRRPDIRKSEKLLAASYEQIGAAMAEWFPKVSLLGFFGTVGTSSPVIPKGHSNVLSVGPLFNWPAIDFGRVYFNIKAQESSQKQAALAYEKAVIQAVQEVENWLISYIEEKNKLCILKKKFENESRRLKLTRDAFKSGIENELTFAIQEKRLDDISLEIIDSEEKIASNLVALYKALGGGW